MSLAEIDVEVAVAVEVRQGDAAAHVFGEVELAGHAVDVGELDAEFDSAVDEDGFGRAGRDRAAGGFRQKRKSHGQQHRRPAHHR